MVGNLAAEEALQFVDAALGPGPKREERMHLTGSARSAQAAAGAARVRTSKSTEKRRIDIRSIARAVVIGVVEM